MLNSESLTAPAISIPQDSYFVDCICTAVIKEGKTLIILPSGESQPDIEGIGRTSVLLRLLGLSIDTGRLIGLQLEDIRTLKSIPIVIKSPPWCRLLTTDMAYLGSTGKKLSLVPTKGERMSFLWDLARYIYRTTTLEYKTGDHRKQQGRQKLFEIFNKIQFKPINGIFGNLEALHLIDEVILLRRKIEAEPTTPLRHDLKGEDRLKQLRKALMVSVQHGSEFWHRDKGKLELRVNNILNSLDPNRLPPVSEIYFSNPDAAIPDYVFDEVTERIKTKENPTPVPDFKEIKTISGIHLHNFLLSRSFYDVDEVRLLVTSGEKIFRDISLWDDLSEVRREIALKILMLKPNSTSVNERERSLFGQAERFLEERNPREHRANQKNALLFYENPEACAHNLQSLYDELPSFRMTFIGSERLLVTSYEKGKRTGEETIFYEITPQHFKAIYDGFDQEYLKIERNSKIVIAS